MLGRGLKNLKFIYLEVDRLVVSSLAESYEIYGIKFRALLYDSKILRKISTKLTEIKER